MEELKKCRANYDALTPITFLERSGIVYSEETSIVYGDVKFSWGETLDRCVRLASSISSLGVDAGDVVAVLAPNIPAMYELQFGAPMAGAVLCCLNIRQEAHAISVLLRHSEAKVLFVDYKFLDMAEKSLEILSKSNAKMPLIILINEPNSRTLARGKESRLEYESLLNSGDPNFEIKKPEDELQPFSLNYTSGTTANPKGVVYSHRGAYLNALSAAFMWGITKSSVHLWTVPLFHCNGWSIAWALAALGGTNVCLRNVTAGAIFGEIAKHGITHLAGAPTVLNIIANAKPQERKHFTNRVEVLTGGAPPPPQILSTMNKLGFHVTHSYGLTETYGPASISLWKSRWDSLPEEEKARLHARQGVRHLGLSGIDVKDPETMQSVPQDGKTIGEVMLRGNTVMMGYLKDSKATEAAFDGGWFHSGDLGVMHFDGYIELKDRSKDIIISGGENISSIEVESVLYSHPDILEAAVVSRPDNYWGETPCAFVKLKENEVVSSESIIAFCRERLPHYMAPRTVIFEDLPKTSTGKVQKHVLRDKAKALGSLSKSHQSKL